MKIKVGMYVRGDFNFGKVKKIINVYKGEDNSHDIILLENGDNPYRNRLDYVADTPQELIQSGDLITRTISINGNKHDSIPLCVSGNLCNGKILIYADMQLVRYNEIIEIWTRTSDNTYTRQWVKDNKEVTK